MLFRMFDLTSGNLSPVVNFEGISKNVMTVGFQVQPILTQTDEIPFPMNRQKEGGCSQEERTAQPESGISKCEISPARCTLPWIEKETSTFLSLANLPSQRTSNLRLPPPQSAGDGRRRPVRSNSHLELTGQTLLLSVSGDIR